MTIQLTTPNACLAIDRAAGGALKIFAEELCSQMHSGAEVVDFQSTHVPKQAVTHFAAWYLYRDCGVRHSAEQTLVTIHHLQRWNDTMNELVRQRVGLVTMSGEWYRYLNPLVAPGRLSLVPHGVNPDEWVSRRKRSNSPRRYNIGVVGRRYCDGRKGERLLAKVVGQLPRDRFRLTIIGRDWEPILSELSKHRIEVDYHEALTFEELKSVCFTFDLFLCTSDIEGGPLPLLETMALGVTPVCTPVGLARDLLGGTGLGYLFPKGNARACSRILRKIISGQLPLINSEKLREAAIRLSWANAARGYEQVYAAARQGHPLPPDPTGYLDWLRTLRKSHRPNITERLALASNPSPTDRWTQPRVWRAWNKFARLAFGTWQ